MSRVSDSKEWREFWDADKRGMIDTMRRNLASDITAGYSLTGKTVRNQIAQILDYEEEYKHSCDVLDSIGEKAANKWCFYDMKRRGVIE